MTRIPGANRVVANVSDGEDGPSYWQTLDARVEKAFTLGGTAELAAFGDFLNLFNSDANESVLDRRPGNVNYLVAVALHPAAPPDDRREVPLLRKESQRGGEPGRTSGSLSFRRPGPSSSVTARGCDTRGPGQ